MSAAPETRRRILDAALACFLADGYESTTVARIRAASGVSNGALFHHFPTKEAIAGGLYLEAVTEFHVGLWDILARNPRTLREGVEAIVAHHLRWVQEHPDQARFLYETSQPVGDEGQEVRRRNEELGAAYVAWYRPLLERGEARSVKPGLVVAIVSGPAHEVCRTWLAGSRRSELIRHTDQLAHAAWAGLAGPAALAGLDPAPAAAPAPQPARLRIELLADDGSVLGTGETPVVPAAPDGSL